MIFLGSGAIFPNKNNKKLSDFDRKKSKILNFFSEERESNISPHFGHH
jgi:hypothetical protein